VVSFRFRSVCLFPTNNLNPLVSLAGIISLWTQKSTLSAAFCVYFQQSTSTLLLPIEMESFAADVPHPLDYFAYMGDAISRPDPSGDEDQPNSSAYFDWASY
jgi:hypothetical protein